MRYRARGGCVEVRRISAQQIWKIVKARGVLSQRASDGEILKEHPTLEAEDITEALQYAAEAVRERMIPLKA